MEEYGEIGEELERKVILKYLVKNYNYANFLFPFIFYIFIFKNITLVI